MEEQATLQSTLIQGSAPIEPDRAVIHLAVAFKTVVERQQETTAKLIALLDKALSQLI